MTTEQSTQSKHTPGPWQALHSSNGTFEIFSKNNDETGEFGRRHICDINNDDVSDKANAALIAAAPETSAERDLLKNILFQRDSRIDQLEHNAKVHLAAAANMQNEISALKALNEELAGALERAIPLLHRLDKMMMEADDMPSPTCHIAITECRAVLAKHKAGGQ